MENNHKQFKPFDKVLVKDSNGKWKIDLYSHFENESNGHHTLSYSIYRVLNKEIIPYEGNEYLVGTYNDPEEEVILEEGEWVMVGNLINSSLPEEWMLREYCRVNTDNIETFNNSSCEFQHWPCAIKFSNFNPNNMEETRKHILQVRNGKIVKYKN